MDATLFKTSPVQVSSDSLERHILQQLAVIGLDALIQMLPHYR
jgi:hypothetical protein